MNHREWDSEDEAQRRLKRLLRQMKRTGAKYEASFAESEANVSIAALICEARKGMGLTQKSLARLVRTTQPVIARLENAKYKGHSLAMLKRIARALGLAVTITLEPACKDA